MRRLAVTGLVMVLFCLGLAASATNSEIFKDRFSSIGWGGSDGSLHWSGPWSEVNDDGDEKKGKVRVVSSGHCANGNCMRIAGGLLQDIGARRSADTSDLESLSLSYDLKNVISLLPLGLTELRVQVRGDGGWVGLAAYNLGDAFSGHYTHDLDDFSSEDFQVRFLVSGAAMTSEVFIDNIEVEGEIAEDDSSSTTTTIPSTTTTTTPSTSTTVAGTTSTTGASTTTTTRPRATTTTTTAPASGSSTPSSTTSTTLDDDGRDQEIGSEVSPSTSSTTTVPQPAAIAPTVAIPGTGQDGGSGEPDSVPVGSGIRAAATGLQANFQGDLFGEVRTISSLGGVDLQAEYTIAAEVIRSSWAWMVLLGLLIAWAIVSRLDRRRSDLEV